MTLYRHSPTDWRINTYLILNFILSTLTAFPPAMHPRDDQTGGWNPDQTGDGIKEKLPDTAELRHQRHGEEQDEERINRDQGDQENGAEKAFQAGVQTGRPTIAMPEP